MIHTHWNWLGDSFTRRGKSVEMEWNEMAVSHDNLSLINRIYLIVVATKHLEMKEWIPTETKKSIHNLKFQRFRK